MDLELASARGQVPAASISMTQKNSYEYGSDLSEISRDTKLEMNSDDTFDDDETPEHHSYSYPYSNATLQMIYDVILNFAIVTWLIFLAAIVIITIVFFHTGLTLFFGHVSMMTLAWVAFASEGMLVFRPFDDINCRSPNKRIQRNSHKIMHYLTGGFMVFGVIFILWNKISLNKSMAPKSIHTFAGLLTIVLVLVQIIAGRKKLTHLQTQGVQIIKYVNFMHYLPLPYIIIHLLYRWHEHLGLLTYACGMCSVVLGIGKVFDDARLYIGLTIVISVVLCVLFAYARASKTTGYAVVDTL